MCGAIWPYEEIRQLAVLTDAEQSYFEETMSIAAAASYCEYKSVSVTVLQRPNINNISVQHFHNAHLLLITNYY